VDSGRYDNVVIHRSILGFVIQGGLLSIDDQQNTVSRIITDPNIVNEFSISNTRGTIAMARVGGQVNSANSQWFINAGNNSSLDSVDGGFTVFGRVLDDGMDVVDAINALFTTTVFFTVAGNLADFPLLNYSGGNLTLANLIDASISREEDLNSAPNVFDESTSLLNIQVDAGAAGLAAVSLFIVSSAPDTVIQVIPESVESLSASVEKMATFDDSSGRLLIPELVIAGAVAFRDVVFILSDVEQLQFTLESFQQ
jgi:peptidyl-prolyl cis-trans isomerase A (cyclophilin A)